VGATSDGRRDGQLPGQQYGYGESTPDPQDGVSFFPGSASESPLRGTSFSSASPEPVLQTPRLPFPGRSAVPEASPALSRDDRPSSPATPEPTRPLRAPFFRRAVTTRPIDYHSLPLDRGVIAAAAGAKAPKSSATSKNRA